MLAKIPEHRRDRQEARVARPTFGRRWAQGALAAALLVTSARSLSGQASPIVALDDPLLPLFEHLVDRGVIRDPTPFVRPFRRAEALAALRSAVPDTTDPVIERLLRAWSPPANESGYWSVAIHAGAEGFTSSRRDLLRPEGPSGVRVLGDVAAHAVLGPVVLETRPTIAQRLAIDPDWTGARVDATATCCRWHFPEAYLGYQQEFFRVHLGQVARNWGPVGPTGIAMSNVAYGRDDIGLEVLSRDLHLISTVAFLRDTVREDGTPTRRYHVATRLGLRVGSAWQLGLWQSAVLEGPSRDVDGPFRNPMILLPLVNQFGIGDVDNNVMIGAHLGWQSEGGIGLQAELALDDLVQRNRENFPDRWAFTLRASAPGPAETSLRLWYTRASTAAFRATDPMESFTERGVGLGRGWADGDRIEARIARPIGGSWLGALVLTGFRRGEGRLDQPIDAEAALAKFPSGTIERTFRAALSLAGSSGPFVLRGEGGISQVTNRGHEAGVNKTQLEAQVSGLLRFGRQGPLR